MTLASRIEEDSDAFVPVRRTRIPTHPLLSRFAGTLSSRCGATLIHPS